MKIKCLITSFFNEDEVTIITESFPQFYGDKIIFITKGDIANIQDAMYLTSKDIKAIRVIKLED